MVILVTGANGQLGQSLRFIASDYPEIDFVFCHSSDLDITDKDSVQSAFQKFSPDYCINAAAYTAVDKAESEPEIADLINHIGTKNLAEVCKETNTTLIHISTDFVFDGTNKIPYTENDSPNPTSVYGKTKLDGENAIQEILEKHFIIRTSWVYSQFGNNFMKTMLRLAGERNSLSVVNDQVGTPTNAIDLAKVIVAIAISNTKNPTSNTYGIYNLSNEGQCSWFHFAKKIFELNSVSIDLIPIPSTSFPTPAKRPAFSVLDKSKIKSVFGIQIQDWAESLKTIQL